jgi:hypothetical protein
MTPADLVLNIASYGCGTIQQPSVDPTMKATMLSKGISEVLNCGVFVLVVAFPGAYIWRAARGPR